MKESGCAKAKIVDTRDGLAVCWQIGRSFENPGIWKQFQFKLDYSSGEPVRVKYQIILSSFDIFKSVLDPENEAVRFT